MSREGVGMFLTRIMEDEAFRDQVKANPDATLAQFDLTPDEVSAIKSADASKLQELGVDERVSKAVTPDKLIYWDSTQMGSSVEGQTVTYLVQILRHLLHP